MENSSRALFIAASVILGVLLLSVMVYVFSQGARVSEAYDQKQITNQLELYNSRFEAFDRDNNNVIDVISLANLAYSINAESEFDPSVSIIIKVDVAGKIFQIPNTQILDRNQILNNSNNKISIYDLANKTLKDLEVTAYSVTLDGGTADGTDKLSVSKLVDGKSIYKYLFKVKDSNDFNYYDHNMKVSDIKLTAYVNPAW